MQINSPFGHALACVVANSNDFVLRNRADKLWCQLDRTFWEYDDIDDNHNRADQMVTHLYPDFQKELIAVLRNYATSMPACDCTTIQQLLVHLQAESIKPCSHTTQPNGDSTIQTADITA
jgi:ligand-binding sensor domain-containing protein